MHLEEVKVGESKNSRRKKRTNGKKKKKVIETTKTLQFLIHATHPMDDEA